MKFQIGDTVKVVADEKRLEEIGVPGRCQGLLGEVEHVRVDGDPLGYRVRFTSSVWWCFDEQDLELAKKDKVEQTDNGTIRKFETGATRDTSKDKLDFEGFISPLVLRRYAQYLHKHRIQSDGTMRDSDNWQQMFGENHFDVCMKSSCRHFIDWWLQHRGVKTEDDLEESICAVIFNAMAYLYKIELSKKEKKTLLTARIVNA